MEGFNSISDTYEIIGEIGSGGGGTVYKAYHKRLQKDVVIKKMHAEVKNIVNSRAETDILKNLRHSYLPQVLDFIEIDGNVYTVMDYIPGKSFQQLLAEGKKFTQLQVIKWARELAEALVYLHNQTPPIIHSDIKPANIMLTPKEDICLIDFNISSVFDNKGTLPIGFSDGYSPPEQYPISMREGKNAKASSKPSDLGVSFRNPNKMPKAMSWNKDGGDQLNGDKTACCDRSGQNEDSTQYYNRVGQMSGQKDDQTDYICREDKQDEWTEYYNFQKRQGNATEYYKRNETGNVTEYYKQDGKSYATELFNRDEKSNTTECYNRDRQLIGKTVSFSHESNKYDEPTEQVLNKNRYNDDSEANHSKDNEVNVINVAGGSYASKARIDERSDIYSLGATLYHILTGVKPNSSLKGAVPLQELNIKISDGLKHIITKAMQPIPDRRYQDASKLMKALTQINKLDKRYKGLMLGQEITVIFMLLLYASAVLSIYYGEEIMHQEKLDRYDSYINDIVQFREAEEYEAFESKYIAAVALFPDNISAYYQRALSLYDQGNYNDGITYIENQVINKLISDSDEVIADIYFILANCYFELEDYESAVKNYKETVYHYSLNNEYYRDYAIALARLNQTKEAAEILQKALNLGLTEDNIYLIKGEIDLANKAYQSSVDNFINCVQSTDSAYVKNRAYVICSKAYEVAGDSIENAQIKNIQLLEEATVKLPIDMTLLVNARLAEAYVEYGTRMQDHSYYQKAIDVFHTAVNMGWDDYNTHNNLSLLYRQLNDYDNSYKELEWMLKEYGDNYNTYKRLAYLEADLQGAKPNEDRDYTKFKEYYDRAFELYANEIKNNKNDTEMDFLESIYQDLVDGKWFED